MITSSIQPETRLDALRQLYLRSIVATYGPWYLIHMPSGLWSIAWCHTIHCRERLEGHLLETDEVDGQYTFATRAAALKGIIASFDEDHNTSSDNNYPERTEAVNALAGLLSGAVPESTNQFTGTPAEANLLDMWDIEDRGERNLKKAIAAAEAAHDAATAEQERRERVFKHILEYHGTRVIDEINGVIAKVWRDLKPTVKGKADAMPMPQLAVIEERLVFECGRAKPTPVRTPQSKREWKVIMSHWKNPAWQEVERLIAPIIDRFEAEARFVRPKS